MRARVYPFGPSEEAAYPDKRWYTLRAQARLKDAIASRLDDDRGNELFIISWGARTREFLQISDAERFVETLPAAR